MKRYFLSIFIICIILVNLSACNNTATTNTKKEPNSIESYIVLPESFDHLYKSITTIVTVKIDETETRNLLSQIKEGEMTGEEEGFYISTATVTEVIKGNVNKGDKIKILQPGDGINTIYTHVIDGGGYLQENTEYLLFLNQINYNYNLIVQKNYGNVFDFNIRSLVGQYKINSNGEIISRSDESNRLVGEIKTVEEMKAKVAKARLTQAQKILDRFKNASNDVKINIGSSDIYVPNILFKDINLDFLLEDIKINKKENENITVEWDTMPIAYITIDYDFLSMKVGSLTEEDKKPTLKEQYKKYEKDGKEYYIASEYNAEEDKLNINLLYNIDDKTSCAVVTRMNKVKGLDDKLAEKVFSDFQCIPIKELQEMAGEQN